MIRQLIRIASITHLRWLSNRYIAVGFLAAWFVVSAHKVTAILWNVVRVLLVAMIVAAVGDVSRRYPRAGALLLSLPIVSILAFLVSWFQHHDLTSISQLARETLILVPLGLPFFIPLACAPRLGMGFGWAFGTGVILASITIGAWLYLAPAK